MIDLRFPRGAFARLGFLAAISFAHIGLATLSPRAAHAEDAKPACEMPYDEAVGYGRRAVAEDPSAVFIDYGGEEAAALLKGINAFPPASEWAAEHILVLERPEDSVIVGLVHEDCLTRAFKIPHDDWATVRRSAIGDAS
jgi:hypothetical protein